MQAGHVTAHERGSHDVDGSYSHYPGRGVLYTREPEDRERGAILCQVLQASHKSNPPPILLHSLSSSSAYHPTIWQHLHT